MKNYMIFFYLILLLILMPDTIHSHGKESHEKVNTSIAKEDNQQIHSFQKIIKIRTKTVHPLIIHFPIVFLTIAFPVYLLGSIVKKDNFKFFAIISVGLGFLGALAATFIFHPHTHSLPGDALAALKYHDLFAEITIIISGIATLLGITRLIKKIDNLVYELIILILLAIALLSISITGHMGGILVYKHGVGIDGKYLEK